MPIDDETTIGIKGCNDDTQKDKTYVVRVKGKRNRTKHGHIIVRSSPHSITLCQASDVTLLYMLLAYIAASLSDDGKAKQQLISNMLLTCTIPLSLVLFVVSSVVV